MVSRALQGEAWAGGVDQGCIGTALGSRCEHAAGAGAYYALLEVVVENVDAVEVVVGRAGGPVRGKAAVRAAEAIAASVEMMAKVMAAVVVALVVALVAASWATSSPRERGGCGAGGRRRRRRQWQ